MTRVPRLLATVVLWAGTAAFALAQGSPMLNVKLGLWEMTIDLGTAGAAGAPTAAPNIDMSKLTPQQQAALEQMRVNGQLPPGMLPPAAPPAGTAPASGTPSGPPPPAPGAVRTCLTKDKVANGQLKRSRPGQDCTDKVTKSTSTVLDVTETCTSTTKPVITTVNEMHIEALTQTSIKITARQVGAPDRAGMPATMTMMSKWIWADCGDVK